MHGADERAPGPSNVIDRLVSGRSETLAPAEGPRHVGGQWSSPQTHNARTRWCYPCSEPLPALALTD